MTHSNFIQHPCNFIWQMFVLLQWHLPFFGSFHGVHAERVQGLKRKVNFSKEREKGLDQDEATHSLC
jgi:hypothetical protein